MICIVPWSKNAGRVANSYCWWLTLFFAIKISGLNTYFEASKLHIVLQILSGKLNRFKQAPATKKKITKIHLGAETLNDSSKSVLINWQVWSSNFAPFCQHYLHWRKYIDEENPTKGPKGSTFVWPRSFWMSKRFCFKMLLSNWALLFLPHISGTIFEGRKKDQVKMFLTPNFGMMFFNMTWSLRRF